MPSDLDVLTDNRSEPGARSVLEDMERSRYRASSVSRLGFALSFIHADDDDAAAAVDDDAAADDDDADDDGARRLTKLLTEVPDMRNGLKIIQVPGRYAGWAVTRVGWLRRVSGDEWELVGARTIVRTGSPRPLDSLASSGPRTDHTLSEAAQAPEEIHRLVIRRSLPADVKVWAKHCPKPADWQDE